VLRAYAIEPKFLRSNDFDAFFAARTEALLQLVEAAMGKPAIRREQATGEQTDAPETFPQEVEDDSDDVE
jgi:hypothetical protein